MVDSDHLSEGLRNHTGSTIWASASASASCRVGGRADDSARGSSSRMHSFAFIEGGIFSWLLRLASFEGQFASRVDAAVLQVLQQSLDLSFARRIYEASGGAGGGGLHN